MFGGLRENSIIYILEKTDDGLRIETGHVTWISNQHPKYSGFAGAMPTFQPTENVVDVKVMGDDREYEFKGLATGVSIANSGKLVISDSMEAISAEVDGIVAASRSHIDAVPYHERILASSDGDKRMINPQFKKERENEEKMISLEGEVSNIKNTLGEMMSMLSSALGQAKN